LSTVTFACAAKFIGHLTYIESTRTKMETLMYNGEIVRRDIEQIYKGLYLDAVCSFEHFLEDLFIGLLTGRFKHPSSNIVPRVAFKSSKVARDIVSGGHNYVDWLPYNHTQQRANAFFRNGLPFTLLEPRDRQIIDQICCIRNAIAHQSNHAKKQFNDKVIGAIPISPRDRTPAAFLRSKFRIAPVQSRYTNLIIEMAGIAIKLCS